MKLLFRVDVKGAEHIPQNGAFLIAPNHISFLDPVVVGAFVPRTLYYMARESLFRIPIFEWLLKICHAIPVRRDKPRPQTMKKVISILKEGSGLLIFPEGTRSITGKLKRGGPGLGMLASVSSAAVIPTKVSGTEKALPVDAGWIRLKKVSVTFGKPVFPDEIELSAPSVRTCSGRIYPTSNNKCDKSHRYKGKFLYNQDMLKTKSSTGQASRAKRVLYQRITDEVMKRIENL